MYISICICICINTRTHAHVRALAIERQTKNREGEQVREKKRAWDSARDREIESLRKRQRDKATREREVETDWYRESHTGRETESERERRARQTLTSSTQILCKWVPSTCMINACFIYEECVLIFRWRQAAQEAVGTRVVDSAYIFLFDLYHHLRTKSLSDIHRIEWAGVDRRWVSVRGVDTRWIPRRSSCCYMHLLISKKLSPGPVEIKLSQLDSIWLNSRADYFSQLGIS